MSAMWKKITGYSKYEVSDSGEVRNVETNRILKSFDNKRGYLKVSLVGDDGKNHNVSVHRLVAASYVDNPDPDTRTQVNHINEVKTDNRAENLEWVTASQNVRHGTGISRRVASTSKPVVMIHDGVSVIFDSAHDAERRTGIPAKNIQKCCTGQLKSTHGVVFAYTSARVVES